MKYACRLVDRPRQATLVIRTHASVDRLPHVLGPAWGAIMAHAATLDVRPSGPPFVVYHDMDMTNLDVEIGFPFERPLDGAGEVHAGEIPPGPAVETVHVGPFDRMAAAYEAVQAWMAEHGHAPAGPPSEHYLDDPQEVPAAELRTRIVWPVG